MSSNSNELTLPVLKIEDFDPKDTRIYTHIYRDGGIRLEQQLINDKNIYHNYGQGQSQVSLAYGCAYIVSKMITLKKQATKTKDVAVIGSGINALMTTLQLIKRGHKVTLYSTNLSVQKKKDGSKTINGSSGLQFWYPGDYDNNDPLKHQLISKLSFEFLKQSLKSNRYQSLKECNLYVSGPKAQQLKENVSEFISNTIKQINVNFGNQKLEEYTNFKTILIDTSLFIEEVFTELKLRNVTIVEKKFQDLKEVLSLKQQFIYNCLGTEVKQIFGDKNVSKITNFNIRLRKQLNELKNNSFIIWKSSEVEGDDDYVLFMANKKVQISSKDKQIDNNTKDLNKKIEKIFGKSYHFVKERSIKPYKL